MRVDCLPSIPTRLPFAILMIECNASASNKYNQLLNFIQLTHPFELVTLENTHVVQIYIINKKNNDG